MLWCCQDGSCLPCFAQFSSVFPFNNCIFLHLQWGTWVICRLWLPRAALEQQAAQGNLSFFCGDRLNLPTTTRWRIILSLGPWLWSTNRGLGLVCYFFSANFNGPFELRKCLIFEGLNNCQQVVQVALCYWIWSFFAVFDVSVSPGRCKKNLLQPKLKCNGHEAQDVQMSHRLAERLMPKRPKKTEHFPRWQLWTDVVQYRNLSLFNVINFCIMFSNIVYCNLLILGFFQRCENPWQCRHGLSWQAVLDGEIVLHPELCSGLSGWFNIFSWIWYRCMILPWYSFKRLISCGRFWESWVVLSKWVNSHKPTSVECPFSICHRPMSSPSTLVTNRPNDSKDLVRPKEPLHFSGNHLFSLLLLFHQLRFLRPRQYVDSATKLHTEASILDLQHWLQKVNSQGIFFSTNSAPTVGYLLVTSI